MHREAHHDFLLKELLITQNKMEVSFGSERTRNTSAKKRLQRVKGKDSSWPVTWPSWKWPIGRTSDIMGDTMACSARTLGSSVLTQFEWYRMEMGGKWL